MKLQNKAVYRKYLRYGDPFRVYECTKEKNIMAIRKIIEINEELCDGCGQCVPGCAEGALQIIDGKAKLVADVYCDGLGACLGECPTGALKLIEREAVPFDEEAVEALLEEQKNAAAKDHTPREPRHTGGCPSSRVQQLTPCQQANQPLSRPAGAAPSGGEDAASALTHWPVKLRLVPPEAPFLKDADILLLADCAALSVPTLHAKYVQGRVVVMGCPKFDDAPAYVEKLAEIMKKASPRSLTVLEMEVPCCSGLSQIASRAAQLAQRDKPQAYETPITRVIASRDGRELSKERIATEGALL